MEQRAIIRSIWTVEHWRKGEMISETVQWFEVAVRGPLPGGHDVELISTEGENHLLRVHDVRVLARLLDSLQQSGSQVLSIWPRKDTLEDLFLREIGYAGERTKRE